MCGRYLLDVPGSALADHFGASNHAPDFVAAYNIAPTQELPVVFHDAKTSERLVVPMKWGLVPQWAVRSAKPVKPFINARAETVAEKPAFRRSFRSMRCVVPASGFYEWQKTPDGKVPYCIRVVDEPVLGLAGLYDSWVDGNGELVRTYTILTTAPNDVMRPLHDRMPVILDDAGAQAWLGATPQETDGLLELLQPFRSAPMEAFAVSKLVNDVRNDHPGLIEPTAA